MLSARARIIKKAHEFTAIIFERAMAEFQALTGGSSSFTRACYICKSICKAGRSYRARLLDVDRPGRPAGCT